MKNANIIFFKGTMILLSKNLRLISLNAEWLSQNEIVNMHNIDKKIDKARNINQQQCCENV